MEYLVLVFLHVFFGIIWAGGAIATGFFIVPSVFDAGPAGGAVMAGVARRRLPVLMTVSAVIVVLAGARLYSLRFSPEWLMTAQGLVLTAGAVLGLGAFAIGVFVQRPVFMRMAALSAAIAASGQPPTADQSRDLQALRVKMKRLAAVTAWHLLGAAGLMSFHRLAAAL